MITPISEIIDRYTICLLKRYRANAQNSPELNTLEQTLNEYYNKYRGSKEMIHSAIIKLTEVNGAIWDLEADIRQGKEGTLGLEEVGRRALKIRDLNQVRVSCKNELVVRFNEGYQDLKSSHASGK